MQRRAYLPLSLLLPASLVLILLLGLPTLALLARAFSPDFLASLLNPTVTEALRLSLLTTSISTLLTILFGTPVAYLLARFEFRGKQLLDGLLDLPLVLPPVVAGVGLLLIFGRRGLIGSRLDEAGVAIAFTTSAVVLAQLFVASPLYIRALKGGFAGLTEHYEAAALTLGATRLRAFWRVSLPLSLASLTEGVVLTWARALGEFGATIVFAGSLSGRSQTMPLAIYAALERDLDAALALSALLTIAAFGLLLGFRYALKRSSA